MSGELVCPHHGEYPGESRRIRVGRVHRTITTLCPKCAEVVDSRVDTPRRDSADIIARILRQSGIGSMYAGASFDAYTPQNESQTTAKRRFQVYADNIEEQYEKGLILFGPRGLGKTHLLTAVCLSCAEKLISVRYTTVGDMVRGIKASWGQHGEEDRVMRRLYDVGLLAMDEIGVQFGGSLENQILHAVIDARLRNRRPTIYATNLRPEDLGKALSESVVDRLRQTCRAVRVEGESMRGRA